MSQQDLDGLPPEVAFKWHLVDRVYSFGKHLVSAATAVSIAYIVLLAIRALAGKDTSAFIVVVLDFLSGPGAVIPPVAPYILAVLLFVWAFLERRLRRRTIKRLTEDKTLLEKIIDPSRTTSGLLSDGKTNPIDR